ncbi:hypothetical protein [Nocardia sp. NPDC019304]|uniref:WXG100 family type VII secretion target n=1 Tax=unclassified Nocardia TaxID=2637762 RepID=UPI0033CEB3DF
MGQALRVDTDLLRALTPELAAIADTAQEELARLKERLAAEGNCWGDDEPGRAFGDSYEPAADKGITGFENLVHNLHGMSSSVADTGEVMLDQDRNIGSQLRKQDPFHSTPVGNAPYDQPRDPAPSPAPSTPEAGRPNPAPAATAPTSADEPTVPSRPTAQAADPSAAASDPTAARGTAQPGYQPTGDPYGPGSMNPGDYGPAGDTGSSGQPAADPGSTPAVQDRATPTARDAAPTGRTPSSPATATPTATEPSPAAAPKPGASGPAAVQRSPETRWTRPPTESPWMRNAPGTPWSRNDGGRAPGQVFPPRRKEPRPDAGKPVGPGKSHKAGKPKPAPAEAKRSHVRTDPDAVAAARALAARHGLRIAGFEDSGVSRRTVDEIAAAVDGILGKYPFIKLGGIEITDLRDGTVSRVAPGRASDDTADAVTGGWILLDRVAVGNPALLAEKVEAAVRSGERVAGPAEQPMYATIVRDLGRILEVAAGAHVRQSAQRSLLMEYRRISGPWDRGETLAAIVRGYREWRAQLVRACFPGDRFDPRAAVVEAFTEVELRGESACGPAKVLHRLAIEHARGQSSA